MKEGFIYLFRNKVNGKCYVGKTINIDRRYREYVNGKNDSAIHRAILKYGADNFDFIILECIYDNDIEVLNEKLNKSEKDYISRYDSYVDGYNLTLGGDGSLGAVRSEETRRLMSESKLGENNPMKNEEVKQRMIQTLKEYYKTHPPKSLSDEAKKKISIANSGKNNGMYGKTGEQNPSFNRNWTKYISEDKLNEFRRKRSLYTTGENNPMYGKSAMKGKHYELLTWIDENGELHTMCEKAKKRYHPEWKLYIKENNDETKEITEG